MPGFGLCTHLGMGRFRHKKSKKKSNHKPWLKTRANNSIVPTHFLSRKGSIIISIGCIVSGVTILITGGLSGAPLLIMIGGSVLVGAGVQSSRYLLMAKDDDFTHNAEKEYIISLAMGGVFGAVAPVIGLLNPGAHIIGTHAISIFGQQLGEIATNFCTISLTSLIKTAAISSLFVLFIKISGHNIDYYDTIGGFVSGSIGSNIATYLSFTCPVFADLIFAVMCSVTPHFPYLVTFLYPDNLTKDLDTSNNNLLVEVFTRGDADILSFTPMHRVLSVMSRGLCSTYALRVQAAECRRLMEKIEYYQSDGLGLVPAGSSKMITKYWDSKLKPARHSIIAKPVPDAQSKDSLKKKVTFSKPLY